MIDSRWRWVALLVFTLTASRVFADGPTVGMPAPNFRLQDQQGKWHSSDEYRGKWLVMFFYAADNLPTSTTQTREFAAALPAYANAGISVVGLSTDDVASHKVFAEKENLPFAILADPTKGVTREFGALKKYLGVQELAKRDTFVIDPKGFVVKRYVDVEPKGHANAVLADVQKLQQR